MISSDQAASPGRPMPRWPLFLIGAPAAVAVWSGWVGLGGLCGFGPIHPLPGIVPGFQLNTAITLPVGIEAYGSYALGAWLRSAPGTTARSFGRASAIGALVLGMLGQAAYHILAAVHAAHAPWPVVVFVSCLPVVSLGFGAALAHLLSSDEGAGMLSRTGIGTGILSRTGMAADTSRGPYRLAERTGDPVRDTVPARTPRARQQRSGPVDRDGLVAGLAAEILTAAGAGESWRPDYPALMARTGYKRSFCEKVVRDARRAALGTELPALSAADLAGRPDAGESVRSGL